MATDQPQLQPRQRAAAYGLARRGDAVLLARASAQSALLGSWFLPDPAAGRPELDRIDADPGAFLNAQDDPEGSG